MRQACNGEDTLGLHTEVVDRDRLVLDPLVSVVMVTYNHEPYIAQAIEGVLSHETDFPIELIIGEDCSTDRTREIVLDFQRRYPEIIRALLSRQNVWMHVNGTRTMLAAGGQAYGLLRPMIGGGSSCPNRARSEISLARLSPDGAVPVASAQRLVAVTRNRLSRRPILLLPTGQALNRDTPETVCEITRTAFAQSRMLRGTPRGKNA